MAREWYATCKDCGKEFGYSDASYQLSSRRGLSRPERCPNCRHMHTREIATLGLSHFEMTPLQPIPATGLQPGRLGGLIRPERVHKERVVEPSFDYEKFGIKDEHIRQYFSLMQQHQVTVIVAPTGAGKSTFLPFRLMSPPEPLPHDLWTRHGQIVITQPRIQATRNIPAFVAEDLHGSNLGAGFDVGFRHSGSPATDWRNKLVYMTDGSLINMIVRNELGRLGVIMIDEAHERSLNIDLILGLLKVQLPRYPKLKLIIASATIDTNLFIDYYGGSDRVGFYEFPGKRQYPVEAHFSDAEPIPDTQMAGRMPDMVADKVFDILLAMETDQDPDLITMTVDERPQVVKGDILAFLHGERPIEHAVNAIREKVDDEPKLAGKVDVLPLYTKLPQKQQDRALKSKPNKNRWRVVISTNVAETSLTVEGIVHVVDSALINESQWDPQTQTTYVMPTIHSQAGCQQRWGRAGRVQPGIAHCLYTEEQFKAFRAHTPPEIMRSPLEQIVLTAKATGVDDVQNFDWIQSPPREELVRAPHYLGQIGALDRDGDLTEHGLELRFFAAETDVANLMILADRFGCAVEMATLIPMLNLGGYTSLLNWDRSWDATTKRSVHRIHQGLIAPCLDDVEFYLKLWEAWDGSLFQRKESSDRWAQRHFVNHSLLGQKIVPERDTLLTSLSGHKKDDKIRSIDFDLLTRVRIVLTYGLSNQIYQLHNRPTSNEMFVDAADYRPYIYDPEANPEMTELHKDAVVEISPESICHNRQLPDLFVCGKRQRLRRRISPQQEPITIITAAFLTLIKSEWLQVIGQPPIAVARMIASEIRSADGSLIPTTTRGRLFIDQAYPIGATLSCQLGADGISVVLGKQEAPPPLLSTRSSYEEIEAADMVEVVEAESELDALAGASETGKKAIRNPDEDEDASSPWLDVLDDQENEASSLVPQRHDWFSHQELFTGRIVNGFQGGLPLAPFRAKVTGYNFDERQTPAVELAIPVQPDPFEEFTDRYVSGDDITVAVTSVEQYVNDWLMYLIVREVQTGMEIVLDPYDTSLIGRSFAIEYFRQFEPGTQFRATVEEIDKRGKHVRVTRLKIAEEAMLRFMGRQAERTVEAVIADVNEYGVYLWLDPAQTEEYVPIGAFAHVRQLPERPAEMALGQRCQVVVKQRQFKKPLRRALPDPPDKIVNALTKSRLGNNVEWSEENQTLTVKGRITYDQRCKLLELSGNGSFRRSINMLFRRSNELDVKVIDITGLRSLEPYQGQSIGVKAKVVSVMHDAIIVEAEGGLHARVPKDEAVWNRGIDLRQTFEKGDEKELLIKRIDMEQGEADVTLLRSEDNPLHKYYVGQVVYADVVNVADFGVFLQLDPDAPDGLAHISELAWWHIKHPEEVAQIGQKVKAQILKIDLEKREVSLTLKLPEDDPFRKYGVDQRVQGQVVGFSDNGSGVFVQLERGVDGYLYKDEVSLDRVNDAHQLLHEGENVTVRITEIDYTERKMRLTIRGLYQADIYVPASHIGLVIGSGGSVIKDIQQATRTYINLDDGNCLIQGMTHGAVNAALKRIETILETRIVTFVIEQPQVPMLIGTRGSTINGIQQSTGAQINLDSKMFQVTVTAANEPVLRRTLEQIGQAIYYYEVTVQISSDKIRYVIGTRGSTIQGIQSQTNARLDIAKDNSGRITVRGNDRYSVDSAIRLIEQNAGYLTRLHENEGSLPPYADVRSSTPPQPRTQSQKSATPPLPRPASPLPPPVRPSSPVQPRPTVSLQPQSFQDTVSMSSAQLSLLMRKQGGFFGLFGGKSPLEKIQEGTAARIQPVTSPAKVIVIGKTRASVQDAVQQIRRAIG